MRNLMFITASILAFAACGDDGAKSTNDTSSQTTAEPDATSSDDATVATEDDATTPDSEAPDTTAPEDTTAAPTDTSEPDTTTNPPPLLAYERYGARIIGAPLALSRTGRTLWLGTRGNIDYMDQSDFPRVLGGLVRYDLDTGETKVFSDELGTEEYYEGGFGPIATANVHQDGERVIVVAHTGLLIIDEDTVTPLSVTMPGDGPAVVPVNLAIARDGLRPVAWMTSDQGLLRLDEDTFAVESVIKSTDVGYAYGDFGKLTIDPDTGTVFASFFPNLSPEEWEQEPPPPLGAPFVVSVTVTGEIATLKPGQNGMPQGRPGDLVWSVLDQKAYIALAAWNAAQGGVITWNGADPATAGNAEILLREGGLANNQALGAQILALDDAHRLLAVGGNALGSPIASPKGAGLAWVKLPAPDTDEAVKVISTAHKSVETPFVLTHVQALQWDPDSGRLYAVISDVCSETKLRSRGLFALSFDDAGVLRFERPLLSSVRTVTDIDDELFVGVRDDNGGIACLGYPYNSGLSHVKQGGLGELELLKGSTDNPPIEDPGVARIGGTTSDALVFATRQDGFYFGSFEHGFWAESPAFYGPARESTDLLWDAAASTLWLAGGTTHSGLDTMWCEDDDPETMCLADRGPRGLAKIEVSTAGVGAVQRFVRASDDPRDVVGLPSGEVYDLLWGDDGKVIVATGVERRYDFDWDRSVQPVFLLDDKPRAGGVAEIDRDNHVTVLAGSDIAPDARAIAWDPNHQLIIADGENGLFKLVDGEPEPIATPGLPEGGFPVMLWTNAEGDLAYGTSKGLWLSWHGATKVLDDVGFVWSAYEKDGHLYVGTDEGLVIFREATVPAVVLPERSVVSPIPF